MLNLDKMISTSVPYRIYCTTGNHIVSRQQGKIQFADCYGNVQNEAVVQFDDGDFDYAEFGDHFAFVFAGRTVVNINKTSGEFSFHQLDTNRIGQCTTKLGTIENDLVFGTKSFGRSQLVRYDPLSQKRVCQTASWNLDSITDFYFQNPFTYIVLNNSMIIKADMRTGQTLFNRFETGSISKRLCPYLNGIAYSLSGILTLLDQPNVKRLPITGRSIDSLDGISATKAYFTSNNAQEIGCFDITSKEIEWSIPSLSPVQESILTRVIAEESIRDALIVRLKDHVLFVDVVDGSILRSEKCDGTVSVKQTGDNLVVARKNATTVFQGEPND